MWNSALSGSGRLTKPNSTAYRSVLNDADRPLQARVDAGFALGTLLDNEDRYDDAFPCFARANALFARIAGTIRDAVR